MDRKYGPTENVCITSRRDSLNVDTRGKGRGRMERCRGGAMYVDTRAREEGSGGGGAGKKQG